jgi:hypothetical protein
VQMRPVLHPDDSAAGRVVDDALAILQSDLRRAVELAERDNERALTLHTFAVGVSDAVSVWQEIDAIAGAAVLNPARGER